MISILLCMDTSTEYNRAIIRGISSYSEEHDNCLLLSRVPSCIIVDSARKEKIAQWAKDWNMDAIIVGILPYDDLLPLADLNASVIFQNLDSKSKGVSAINEEYSETGQIAADFFIRKRFENFAYFGIKNAFWSEQRAQGYRNRILGSGFNHSEYMIKTDTIDEAQKIIRWLKDLPKPVAIFCCNDKHALVISEYCHIAKIDIPREISILGVDNDELICNLSSPPLSSIVLDAEQAGYEVGQQLAEQKSAKDNHLFVVSIKPGIIIQRGSTKKHNIEDKEVAKMLEFIDDNFTRDISTTEIFDQAFLCRRAAEIRFKKVTGMTVYRYLIEQRLNHLCTLLKTTDLSLTDCAARSGIFGISYLFHIFKKYKGCSPTVWRSSNKD